MKFVSASRVYAKDAPPAADALLHVRMSGGEAPMVARTEGRRTPAPGQQVTFRVQPDDVFTFHPVTGARLAG